MATSSLYMNYLKSTLGKASTEARKREIIIVSHLRLYTYRHTIFEYFKQYGTVVNISYVYDHEFDFSRRATLKYTRCCLVEFKDRQSIESVTKVRNHRINNYGVRVTEYRGRKAHKELLERGCHKLVIQGMPHIMGFEPVVRKVRNKKTGLMEFENGSVPICVKDDSVIYLLEDTFAGCDYNRIKIGRSDEGFNGYVTIRFRGKNECEKARQIAETMLECRAAFTTKSIWANYDD